MTDTKVNGTCTCCMIAPKTWQLLTLTVLCPPRGSLLHTLLFRRSLDLAKSARARDVARSVQSIPDFVVAQKSLGQSVTTSTTYGRRQLRWCADGGNCGPKAAAGNRAGAAKGGKPTCEGIICNIDFTFLTTNDSKISSNIFTRRQKQ